MRAVSALALVVVAVAALGAIVPFATGGVTGGPTPASIGVIGGDAADASAGTHGNHISIDAQVTSDGTVIAETVSTLTPSFVVIRTDDDGRPGDPVGHTFVETATFRTSVAVGIDDETWGEWSGNRTVWAVLHADDGDGEFDVESDPSLESRSPVASRSFALGAGEDGHVRVLARGFAPRQLRDGAVTVRRVDLASDGFVVATSTDGDEVVGNRSLDAGSHENVTVELDESFVDDQRDPFRIRLVAYRDDGDGTFGDGDRPVRVDGEPVRTDIVVRKADDPNATDDGPVIITPSPTESGSTGTETGTDDSAPTGTTSDEHADTGNSTGGDATANQDSTTTGASGPGLGVPVALLGIVCLFLGRLRARGGPGDR